jgi:hypothetical protein
MNRLYYGDNLDILRRHISGAFAYPQANVMLSRAEQAEGSCCSVWISLPMSNLGRGHPRPPDTLCPVSFIGLHTASIIDIFAISMESLAPHSGQTWFKRCIKNVS